VALGPNGVIGSLAWEQAGNVGIEPGYEPEQDSNFEFPDVDLPYTSGTTPPSRDIVEDVRVVTTTKHTDTTVPTGPVSKLSTNISSWGSGYVAPSPAPVGTYSTNINVVSNVLPSPLPPTITVAWTPTTSDTAPAAGTYWGTVTVKTTGKKTTYEYNAVTGYSYTKWFWPVGYTYTWQTYSTNMVTQTNHYDYVLESSTEHYYVNALNGKTLVTANATFVIGNGVTMGSDDVIKIAPSGSLKLHVDGHSMTVAGQGFMNESGLAKNLEVRCTENVTDVSFSGNGGFIGIFVAPNANVTLNGGGADVFDFTGSLMCNSITLNGHFNFHYDEALSRLGGNGRFLISSWDEIPVN
jgi:hypothetical protein